MKGMVTLFIRGRFGGVQDLLFEALGFLPLEFLALVVTFEGREDVRVD